MSQGAVAETLGVTFQQVQKYENGMNRLSGGRLNQLANLLDVPVTYFFEERQTRGAKQDEAVDVVTQMLMTRDGSKLCSLWLKMPSLKRHKVLNLVEMMAE